MKTFFCLLSLIFLLPLPNSFAQQYKPQEDLDELFVEVQLSAVFPDSKTFVDCIPRYPVSKILDRYQEEKQAPEFDLTAFVKRNFFIPQQADFANSDTFQDIDLHIENLWGMLVRKDTANAGTLIALPYPYVVPGGRFNEMYYWDSYFTMLGLQASGKDTLIQHMVNNFAWLIDEFGFIPNGTRTYYLSRSQPPFFSLMVGLLADIKGEEIYVDYLPQLLAEHAFWMTGDKDLGKDRRAIKRVVRLGENEVLNRYWDNDSTPRPEAFKEDIETASKVPVASSVTYRNIRAAAESGWDFSARWFRDGLSLETIHTTEIIPVDLNSLLYHLELTIAKAYALKNEPDKSRSFAQKARDRKLAILKYCWNDKEDFFMDYDFVAKTNTPVFSLAGLYPLFFQIAAPEQAEKVAAQTEQYFLYPGGLPSTLLLTGQQWDAPNGWAPLQWMSYRGLKHYGYEGLADTLEARWTKIIEEEYRESGKLLEKYNVVFPAVPGGGGEYPTQDGFGWTNGVYLKMVQERKVEKGNDQENKMLRK